jgi:hypothetical protein
VAYENARGRADKQANDGKKDPARLRHPLFAALFFRILPAYCVVIAAGILMLVYRYFAF